MAIWPFSRLGRLASDTMKLLSTVWIMVAGWGMMAVQEAAASVGWAAGGNILGGWGGCGEGRDDAIVIVVFICNLDSGERCMQIVLFQPYQITHHPSWRHQHDGEEKVVQFHWGRKNSTPICTNYLILSQKEASRTERIKQNRISISRAEFVPGHQIEFR